MKVLILFGHPSFQSSVVNKKMVEGIADINQVTFHDLYEVYPEMDIDIDAEQAILKAHDCVIFHHPMYWYSTPAIFKEWQDLVLEYGWAYGSKGNELKGKLFFNALTTGAAKTAFEKGAFQDHTVQEFLTPFTQMARLCGMIPLPPFVVHGTHLSTEDRLIRAKNDYHEVLKLIADEQFELDAVLNLFYLNDLVKATNNA